MNDPTIQAALAGKPEEKGAEKKPDDYLEGQVMCTYIGAIDIQPLPRAHAPSCRSLCASWCASTRLALATRRLS